jgi:hypothetical protein
MEVMIAQMPQMNIIAKFFTGKIKQHTPKRFRHHHQRKKVPITKLMVF